MTRPDEFDSVSTEDVPSAEQMDFILDWIEDLPPEVKAQFVEKFNARFGGDSRRASGTTARTPR
jgi:hypothetical protein